MKALYSYKLCLILIKTFVIFRLKLSVACLSQPSLGSNKVLDDDRYLAVQWAALTEKLGICNPPIDVTALREILSESGMLCYNKLVI